MFDIEASLDSRLLALPRNRPTVVFPEALEPRTLAEVAVGTCAVARETPSRAIASSVDTAPWRRATSTSGWQAIGAMTYFDLFRNT